MSVPTQSVRRYLISMADLKTFCQGALGAMTFGAYHQYTTNRMIEMNNKIQNLKFEEYNRKIDELSKSNIELKNRIDKQK